MANYVITISREYGSGGRLIGQKLAEELGIAFYDKEIINLLVQESGLPQATVEEWVEKKTPIAFYEVYMPIKERPVPDQIYLAKTRLIQNLAEKESCVIVGNCADYILKDHANCLRVFIHASKENRAARILRIYGETDTPVETRISEKDKSRKAYYQKYTGSAFGDAENYQIALDSGELGLDSCVQILRSLY